MGETLAVSVDLNGGDARCRLCAGRAIPAFQKLLLGKLSISFFRCLVCGSLQSQEPTWLDEAYASYSIDTGAAQRVLYCMALTHSVMHVLNCSTTLDFGGGSGLLCRLLRDAGWDAYWYDQFTGPGYAAGFTGSPQKTYDLLTAFEVIEHFPNPEVDLATVFSGRPKALLFMTELYTGQDENWSYLAPEEGQHVFFYSPDALRRIGDRFGYHPLICCDFVLFLKEAPTHFQRLVLQRVLRRRVIAWIKLLLLSRGGTGAYRDYEILTSRIGGEASI